MNIINSINWVDLLILVIMVRIIYSAIQTGIVVELFKLLGTLLTAFVCLHFYTYVGILLQRITNAPPGWMMPVAFLVLWAGMFLVCWLIRSVLLMVFTIEAQSFVDKWGGAFLGIGRFFVVASLFMFLLLSTGDKYFEKMTINAFSRKTVLPVAPGFYLGVCDGFILKQFPSEKVNIAVIEELKKTGKR